MRYVTILFLLVMMLIPEINAQSLTENWTLLEGSPHKLTRHDDMFFLDENLGWLVNGPGQVYKTEDGGETWDLQMSGGPYFRAVGFANEQLGWIGSLVASGTLFESTDGGATWQDISDRIEGPAPTGICGIYVVNESVAYGVGRFDGPPILIKTIDGGATWQSSDLSAFGITTLVDVHFFDEQHGFVTGGASGVVTDKSNAIVAETTDGGETWTIRHETQREDGITGEWGWKISFPSAEVGYVSVEYPGDETGIEAKILKTIDGGENWEPLTINGSRDPAGLQGVGFVNENVGWVSGRGTTSITIDGGETWHQVNDMDGVVNRFRMVNDTLAYAVGRRVYRWNGTSVATAIEDYIERPKAFTLEQNYPNPFNPSTTIKYTLHEDAPVRIRILNTLSQEVRRLVDSHQATGPYEVTWDGRNDAGQRLASGTYLYLIDIGGIFEMKKMVMLK